MVCCFRLKDHWRRRSRFEKRLYILSLVLSLTILCLIISIVFVSHRKAVDSSSGYFTCQTEECKKRGKELKSWINISVDPCDDFYTHCCGGYLQENPLPPNTEIYGRFEQLQVTIDQELKELLTGRINDKNSSHSITQMLRFYNACLDTEGIDRRGTSPLLSFLEELGGWPLLSDDWNSSDYDWIKAISSIVRRAITGYVIRFIVSPDPKNTSNIIIQLDRPTLQNKAELLSTNETTNTSALNRQKEVIKKVALFLNASNSNLEGDIEGIVDFERSMAKMMVPPEEYSKNTYNKAKVREFQTLLPKFELLRYLQLITNETLMKDDNEPITSDDTIIIRDIFYLQNLTAFVKEQPKVLRQIANYLGWMVIEKFSWNLPSELAEILSDSNSTLERWRFCMSLTQTFMGYAVAHVYVAKNDWSARRNNVKEMVDKQKTVFKRMLKDAEWMEDQTQRAALRKIEAMKSQIGYPDWLMSGGDLDEYYQQMSEMGQDAFKNYLFVAEYTCTTLIMQLRKKSKHSIWPISPLTANAVYNHLENTITVPVAMFQFPVYNIDLPRYINYATIGFIIGHEITHGFDNEGSKRDEFGNEVNWWTNNSRNQFNARADCFVQQYDSYGVNGKLELAENIADNGGLKNAYLGYKMLEEEGSQPLLLPGFEDYTADQLFFLSYCTLWCTQYGELGWNVSVSSFTHSPAPYRIRGPASNMKEFSEAFKCGSSKKMNPREKCRIW